MNPIFFMKTFLWELLLVHLLFDDRLISTVALLWFSMLGIFLCFLVILWCFCQFYHRLSATSSWSPPQFVQFVFCVFSLFFVFGLNVNRLRCHHLYWFRHTLFWSAYLFFLWLSSIRWKNLILFLRIQQTPRFQNSLVWHHKVYYMNSLEFMIWKIYHLVHSRQN